MQQPDTPVGSLVDCMRRLSFVARRHANNANDVASCGGIEVVVGIMKRYSDEPELQSWGCKAWGRAAARLGR